MSRKLWSVTGALTLSLALTGVAWAGLGGSADTSTGTAAALTVDHGTAATAASSASSEVSTTAATTGVEATTRASLAAEVELGDDTAATTLPEDSEDDDRSTPPSTLPHREDDADDDDRDDHEEVSVLDDLLTAGVRTIDLGAAGTLTAEVGSDGRLQLLGIDLNPGWEVEVDQATDHEIELEVSDGSVEIEFHLEVTAEGRLRIEVERES
jgi:hypothetical protein